MVDQSGGSEPHWDPSPGREDRGAAGAPGGLGETGRVQCPVMAGKREGQASLGSSEDQL